MIRTAILGFALALLFLCSRLGFAEDTRLMSNAEYTAYLDRLERVLPRWEERMLRIDAEKLPNLQYKTGKTVMDQRQLTLMEFRNVRTWIQQERASHKVSRQFALASGLGSIYDGFDDMGFLLPSTLATEPWLKDMESLT